MPNLEMSDLTTVRTSLVISRVILKVPKLKNLMISYDYKQGTELCMSQCRPQPTQRSKKMPTYSLGLPYIESRSAPPKTTCRVFRRGTSNHCDDDIDYKKRKKKDITARSRLLHRRKVWPHFLLFVKCKKNQCHVTVAENLTADHCHQNPTEFFIGCWECVRSLHFSGAIDDSLKTTSQEMMEKDVTKDMDLLVVMGLQCNEMTVTQGKIIQKSSTEISSSVAEGDTNQPNILLARSTVVVKGKEEGAATVAPKRKRGRPPKLQPKRPETPVTVKYHQNGGVGTAKISVVEGGQVTEVSSPISPGIKLVEKSQEPINEPNVNPIKEPNEISVKEPNENP
ncbi:Agenet-like domain-containing protein [Artemisia annua]|uniref:Agenet-like domain-containing protein n=1 Tax=Artemisia annua TaxID=35608 RepID=A0A2U1LAK0_ARTAN|nr:Agenet-like domain-containing protein [Artemisia annua]